MRPDAEIAAVFGDSVLAEARINPDGTLDFTRWARPQNDGPALEVLALTRWRDAQPDLDDALQAAMLELVSGDLDFIRARVSERCFDIWEEESGYHYYTQLAQAEALARGAEWLEEAGDATLGSRLPFRGGRTRTEFGRLLECKRRLLPAQGLASPAASGKRLSTFPVILGVLHAGRKEGAHSVLDPRAQATLTALEDLFDAEYAINSKRPPERGPAMGRYANDAYFGGNPWYLATLAAAEFYFKLAISLRSGGAMPETSENERFRRTHHRGRNSGELGLRRGLSRTRRRFHANRASVHSSERRSFGAIRSNDGHAALGQTSRLELRRLHHRRREPPPGRPGHSRLRSLRDFLKPGVTIRFPN